MIFKFIEPMVYHQLKLSFSRQTNC